MRTLPGLVSHIDVAKVTRFVERPCETHHILYLEDCDERGEISQS